MRQILLLLFLTINLVRAFGQGMTKEQERLVKDFIDCVKNHNVEKLSTKVAYPFNRQYPIPSIKNKEDFLKRYDEVFDDKLTKLIVDSDPLKDWSAVGWRGIMLLNGELWLDYDGTLITVNYQSAVEAKKMNELIQLEKSQLYAALKEFKLPVHILETTKYRIRIDDMGNYTYRYASWKIDSKMSDKPDLIILNGEFVSAGSGGNHSFEFTNGAYKYHVKIGGMETPVEQQGEWQENLEGLASRGCKFDHL